MWPFLLCTGAVTLAEIGDKTQLLSLVLAARYRAPWPIAAGILVATLLNHAFAAAIGAWVLGRLGPETLRWLLGISFMAMAGWILVPDQLDEEEEPQSQRGVFLTTVGLFFLAEMGDKTQIATVALAARFPSLPVVVGGSTLGMMLANAPVVFFGDLLVRRLPLRPIRWATAAIFAGLGLWTLSGGAAALPLP